MLALLVMFSQRLAHAQSLLPPEEIPNAARQIDSHPRKNTIGHERIHLTRVSNLGFDLRYTARFSIQLAMGDISEGGKVEARIRVTPEKGAPVLLGEYFDIPTATQALSTLPRPVLGPMVASVSGSFVIGPGKYNVELLLISPENKTFFKEWSLKTQPSSGFVGFTKANTVEEVVPRRWDGKLNSDGVRVTVLLNATPTSLNATAASPNVWYLAHLTASDLQLLDFQVLTAMVKTILERLPCRSVRIVAFNLDQQVVLFERDGFTADGWSDLETALKGAQLSTIDYRALQAGSERDFLAQLVEKEVSGPADAVVLVGERTHFLGKTPNEIRASLVAGGAKPYYLRSDYYPVILDDISYLVQDLHGTVMPFFSSGEFGRSVEQLRTELVSLRTPPSSPDQGQTPPSWAVKRHWMAVATGMSAQCRAAHADSTQRP